MTPTGGAVLIGMCGSTKWAVLSGAGSEVKALAKSRVVSRHVQTSCVSALTTSAGQPVHSMPLVMTACWLLVGSGSN